MRRVLLSSVALSFIATAAIAAQQRSSPVPIPRPAPVASAPSTPATDSHFTSTLIVRDPRTQPTPAPFPRGIVRSVVFPGVPFLWGWGVPAFYADAPRPLTARPGDAPTGGVQLDVTPWRSSVYVDGTLVGRVYDFRGYYHHLDLVAGPHQIAIVENGYQPLVFEVVATPGRTITYRATLSEVAAP